MNEYSEETLILVEQVLRELQAHPEVCLDPQSSAGRVYQQAHNLVKSLKKARKKEASERDRELIERRQIRRQRSEEVRPGDAVPETLPETVEVPEMEQHPVQLVKTRRCYVCKQRYSELHFFYDLMCPPCAKLNYEKRTLTADLNDRVCLVTGGRMKIGFHIVLKLLRAGAEVMITTRFPHDAAQRFSREDDFTDWQHRLQIYATDFRHLPSVEQLTSHIREENSRLDVIINNAAQTVRRPPAFYRHLLETEAATYTELTTEAKKLLTGPTLDEAFTHLEDQSLSEADTQAKLPLSAALTQWPIAPGDDLENEEHFPSGQFDRHGQQMDYREENSWVQTLSDVSLPELLEVHMVNTFTPYRILSQLEPLLFQHPDVCKYVVNVSAMEGRFDGAFKTGYHPHTNMAKAALNMITRTCSEKYAKQNVFMTSVDTGWVTNEFPLAKVQRMAEEGFRTPLDEVDGAARVCDPIFTGINTGENIYGKFLKDYHEITW